MVMDDLNRFLACTTQLLAQKLHKMAALNEIIRLVLKVHMAANYFDYYI